MNDLQLQLEGTEFSQRKYVVSTNKISKDGVGSPLN